MSLNKENVAKVLDYIASHPENLDMDVYVFTPKIGSCLGVYDIAEFFDTEEAIQNPACGTVFCVAGACGLLALQEGSLAGIMEEVELETCGYYDFEHVAGKWLGLERDERRYVFHDYLSWKKKPKNFENPALAVKAAIEYITKEEIDWQLPVKK